MTVLPLEEVKQLPCKATGQFLLIFWAHRIQRHSKVRKLLDCFWPLKRIFWAAARRVRSGSGGLRDHRFVQLKEKAFFFLTRRELKDYSHPRQLTSQRLVVIVSGWECSVSFRSPQAALLRERRRRAVQKRDTSGARVRIEMLIFG